MPAPLLFGYAFIGAFTLYILNRLQKRQPFSILSALNWEMNTPEIIVIDLVLSSLLGAFVVIPLVNPNTVPQALIAGLGFTGILSVHTRETQ
jgi:hypothetical protein